MTGKSGLERKRQIDDAHRAGCHRAGKLHETIAVHCASPVFWLTRLRPEFTFDRLGVGRKALANVLGDIAHEHIFKPALERRHD